MGLGRYLVDDENSVFVQAARTVQLTDDTSIYCKSTADADTLREHLAGLSGHGLTEVSLGDGLSVFTPQPDVLTRFVDSLRNQLHLVQERLTALELLTNEQPAVPVKRAPGRPRKVTS